MQQNSANFIGIVNVSDVWLDLVNQIRIRSEVTTDIIKQVDAEKMEVGFCFNVKTLAKIVSAYIYDT